MTVLGICAAALTAVTLALTLRPQSAHFALLVSFLAGALLLGTAITEAAPVFSTLSALCDRAAMDEQFVSALIKAVGIALCTQLTADACRDAGESGVAHKVELCGRVLIAVVSLPVFEEVISLADSLFSGI